MPSIFSCLMRTEMCMKKLTDERSVICRSNNTLIKAMSDEISSMEKDLEDAFNRISKLKHCYYFFLGWASLSLIGIPGLLHFHRLIKKNAYDKTFITGTLTLIQIGIGGLALAVMAPMASRTQAEMDALSQSDRLLGVAPLGLLLVAFLLCLWLESLIKKYFSKLIEFKKLKSS